MSESKTIVQPDAVILGQADSELRVRLLELVEAGEYLQSRVIQTNGADCMDKFDHELSRAKAALIARLPVGQDPVAAQSIPEGWALVDLSTHAILPQLPSERMIGAGWPAGEMISECFDSVGAYADLIAAYPANGSGVVHGKEQLAHAAAPVDVLREAAIESALGYLSTALDDLDSSPDRRPGVMVSAAMTALRAIATHPQPAAAEVSNRPDSRREQELQHLERTLGLKREPDQPAAAKDGA
ncbi:hypothetical protein [Xanthomonas sp. CFBP 7698]|uniref:hypothetical protein n=1 Tax=Xanthomonas sp. CFBP 7698 TaxID=2082399 RepID=UPI000EDE3446|nr:hypothetical protein [Xanthomonas sp. CFBP 7698]RJS04836.1 hypothetical protein XnspCFBP7698_00825 [Xanthomonas sp. CFBP 7698]